MLPPLYHPLNFIELMEQIILNRFAKNWNDMTYTGEVVNPSTQNRKNNQ